MKKILLSAVLFATAVTGLNAQQCVAPTSATTNGYWMDYTRVIEYSLFGEANTQIFQEHPAGDPVNGIVDRTADSALELKLDVNYGIGSYGNAVGGGRHLHHTKVFIDLNDNGSFDDTDEEVFASDVPVAYMDGKNSDYSTYNEGFVLPANATVGMHTMRFVSQKVDAAETANTITACGPYVDGNIVDVKIDILDPNSTPPSAAGDSFYTTTGVSHIIDVIANDAIGSNPVESVVITVDPVNGVASLLADNTIEYTPNADYRGVDVIQYKLIDEKGLESGDATVKVVVYGKKGDVVIIEDFDIADESLGGLLVDDTGLNWDGSFNQALDWGDANTALDATKQNGASFDFFGDSGLSMEIAVMNDPDNVDESPWSINDAHLGRKIDGNTSYKFSASDENNVIGMQVMVQKEIAGAKFGLNIKQTSGDKTVYFLKMDATSFKEFEWNLVYFDLSAAKDGEGNPLFGSYTGEFFLHSIGIAADADVSAINSGTAWVLNIDEIGLYPSQGNLSNGNVELEGVSVYPNPVKDVLNIKAGKDANITVVNAIGSMIYQGKAESINTQSWNKGLYFVVIEEGNKTKTVKVIK